MTGNDPKPSQYSLKKKFVLLGTIGISLLTLWLMFTPAGLDGKLTAVAYSVCHQIESHSLWIGEKLLPLCSRCTGMFLGTSIGMIFLGFTSNGSGYPQKWARWILGLLAIFFVIDGINSTVNSLFEIKSLYTPNNSLRLFSGLGMGMVLASILIPIWRQMMRPDITCNPLFDSWISFLVMILVEGLTGALVIFAPVWLYYPIALFSISSVVGLISIVYTLLWVSFTRKEIAFQNWQESVIFIMMGLITALAQIGMMDALRFFITRSWSGFQL